MATTIKLKNGSGAPLAGDLVAGEPALDLTNKRLYTEDSGGTVIEIGTSPSTIDINAGTIDGTVIGGSSAAAGTFTTFTSTGIDDNATSTAITIDSSQNSTFSGNIIVSKANPAIQLTTTGSNAYIDQNTSGATLNLRTRASGGTLNNWLTVYEDADVNFAGNVGIGTSSPNELLTIESSAAGTTSAINLRHTDSSSNTRGGTIVYNVNNGSAQTNAVFLKGFKTGNTSGGIFTVSTADTSWSAPAERMRIDSSGNVGIGTASPSRKFHVNSGTANAVSVFESTDATAYIQLKDTGGSGAVGTTGSSDGLRFWLGDAATEAMRIDSSGNLLVGTTGVLGQQTTRLTSGSNPVHAVQHYSTANADWYMLRFFNGAQTAGGSITLNTSTLGVAYNTTSDVRLKENIVDAPAGNIDDIRVRSFNWKSDGTQETYGMIAQELVESAPYAVHQGLNEDDMWGVDYSKLIPMMIKEIQDLKAEVAALKGA